MAEARVVVVDDEPNITDLVATALRYEGFDVAVAGTGSEAIDVVRRFDPHLVVLDVMLPDFDGFEVVRRLGESGGRVPVVFLTARDAVEDRVRGLSIGGDDYVTKPFSISELVARVRAVLRRTEQATPTSVLRFGDLELDEDTFEVNRGGRGIELTATEFRLLHYLLANPRKVLTRRQLLDHVWDYDFGGDAGVLETYVSYLRKKLGEPSPIRTVRGVGYTLREPKA
jgi:two-component system OmpR family response regulator